MPLAIVCLLVGKLFPSYRLKINLALYSTNHIFKRDNDSFDQKKDAWDKTFFKHTPLLNPLMHNVPKWSDTL